MSKFFKGSKRKLGCVTLMTACGLMLVWMRSLTQEDEIAFTIFERRQCLDSVSGTIHWWSWSDPTPSQPCECYSRKGYFNRSPKKGIHLIANERFLAAEMKMDVDDNGEIQINLKEAISESLTMYKIPYWLIIMPVTLLSAYLLANTGLANPVPTKPLEPA